MKSPPTFRKYFVNGLRNCYPEDADKMIEELDMHFSAISDDTKFAAKSSNPMDKRLDFTACFLALIKTLENRGVAYDEIRQVCLDITYAYVAPKNPFHAQYKKLLPVMLTFGPVHFLLRKLQKKLSVRGHDDGFRASIIFDKEETYGLGYGVDIHECGICKLFAKHNAFKYSSILCEVDKITTSFAGLEMIRTGTIATGADKCDFRYRRR